jgi:hypothetical protein
VLRSGVLRALLPSTGMRWVAHRLAVLGEHRIPSRVVADAAYIAGVVNAARAGLGVALLALAGPLPDGLFELTGLPAASPISLTARVRPGPTSGRREPRWASCTNRVAAIGAG